MSYLYRNCWLIPLKSWQHDESSNSPVQVSENYTDPSSSVFGRYLRNPLLDIGQSTTGDQASDFCSHLSKDKPVLKSLSKPFKTALGRNPVMLWNHATSPFRKDTQSFVFGRYHRNSLLDVEQSTTGYQASNFCYHLSKDKPVLSRFSKPQKDATGHVLKSRNLSIKKSFSKQTNKF